MATISKPYLLLLDGMYVFGHRSIANNIPYIPTEADTIIHANVDTISAVRIAGAFNEWEDIEPTYNNVNRYLCYNESAVCTIVKGSSSISWTKKYLSGITETGSFSFVGTGKMLSKAYLNKENMLQGIFLNSEGVYTFTDSEVSLVSAGFPSAFPTTPSHQDDTYDYVYYASDDDRFYDSFLGNKILFSTEGFSKWIINNEYPLEQWYKKFITVGSSKVQIWHSAGTNIPYSFTIGVHANYYVEWVNDDSASYLTATSIRFKSNDDKVNADITQYITGRYIELLSIMPVLVMGKKYMLLYFGDYLVLFDRAGKVVASQSYGTARTLDSPVVTKKVAEKLMKLLG